ncbi:MAG: hypothetical protein AABX66_03540 [Nanoarchaeota archaeon]
MHQALYIIPEWFFDFSVVMEILFSLVTLAVAVSGMAVYKIIKDKKIWRFSLGFLMISISYAAWAALNTHIASTLDKGILMISLTNPPLMHVLAVYTYIIFFIAGLVTLVYTTLKVERGELLYLLLGLALTAVVSSVSMLVTFRIVALFLLTYLVYYYFNEWYTAKNKRTCWTLAAFILLVLSNLFFIFTDSTSTFVLGHIIELGAYLILLVSLLRTLRIK